jgi:hypothetical protein
MWQDLLKTVKIENQPIGKVEKKQVTHIFSLT